MVLVRARCAQDETSSHDQDAQGAYDVQDGQGVQGAQVQDEQVDNQIIEVKLKKNLQVKKAAARRTTPKRRPKTRPRIPPRPIRAAGGGAVTHARRGTRRRTRR